MTAELGTAVLTARRTAQHIRLSESNDAYEHLCILTLTTKPRPVSALCWQIHPLLAVRVPPLRVWVHCPRASNGLLPRRSNLVGYVRWDERSNQSSFQTINSNSFTRSQPSRILLCHLYDEFADVLRNSWPTNLRLPFPKQLETLAMPAYQSLWFDDDQGLFPIAEARPEDETDTGGVVQSSRLGLSLLIEGQLLSQEQDLRAQGCARAEQEAEEKKSVRDQIGDQVKQRIQ